jgi:hypothetical protein
VLYGRTRTPRAIGASYTIGRPWGTRCGIIESASVGAKPSRNAAGGICYFAAAAPWQLPLVAVRLVANYMIQYGMGGRAVEGTGLENRQGCKPLVGSNPTPSAM